MAVMGVLAKIWPAALGVVSWWRGKRASTVVIAATAAAAIAVNFSPPVQSIVRAGGLHTETVAGSVIGFGRALRGSDLGIVRTATAYIDAPGWTLGINLLVGGAIALLALRAVRTEFSWERCWCLVGALTIGGVLASPFFSTQYVSWFAPFAAIRRQTTWQMLGVSVLSLIVIVGWFRLFDGTIWWWAVLLARNALVIVVGGSLIRAMSLSDRSRRSVEATNTVR
jgi:hypothetical protein